MAEILLLSLPFVSINIPSMALSQLKSVLSNAGHQVDVHYLNVAFRHFCEAPDSYDYISKQWILGELVFSHNISKSELISKLDQIAETVENSTKEPTVHLFRDIVNLVDSSTGFIDHCVETINWGQYDIVGFTSVFAQQNASLALAKAIKKRWPKLTIVFGGPNCQGPAAIAWLAQFPFIDWVVDGEGEVAIVDAIYNWEKNGKPTGVSGVLFRNDNKKIINTSPAIAPNMDALPLPDYQDFFNTLALYNINSDIDLSLPIEFSRGCWWGDRSKCIFCGLNGENAGYRRKSSARILAEITTQTENYGISRLQIMDNIVHPSIFRNVLLPLAEKGGLERIFMETRSSLTRQQLFTMKQSGVVSYQPGIESLDTEILCHMGKGTTLFKNLQLLKWSREYELDVQWNIITDIPGEPIDGYDRMAQIVPLVSHFQPPNTVGPVILQRFSPLFQDVKKGKHGNFRPHPLYAAIYPNAGHFLQDMAFVFEFVKPADENETAAMKEFNAAMESWMEVWKNGNPPIMGYVKSQSGQMTIFDSRPCRVAPFHETTRFQKRIIELCDTTVSFEKLQRKLHEEKFDLPEKETIAALDELIAARLFLHENGKYISLACDLTNMKGHGNPLIETILLL